MSVCAATATPRSRALAALLLAAALLGGGCATGPNAHPQDPLEPWNRGVYKFNDSVDRALLKPVATAYTRITPRPVQTGVRNFFGNLGDVWSMVNSLMQFKGQAAMNSFWRFMLNTTFGMGGVFDIATLAGLERNKQDFGLTLARWGMGSGPYMMLPFLGPSSLRDTAALPLDMSAHPAGAVSDVRVRNSLSALEVLNQRAQYLSAGDLLQTAALDPYSFMRDAWLQQRAARVRALRAPSQDDDGYAPAADEGSGALEATQTENIDDGYAPDPDGQAAAPSSDMDGYAPDPDGADAQAAPAATPPASVPQNAAPYYIPAVPEVLDRIYPGLGSNLWKR